MSASETGCERECRGKAAAILLHTLLRAGLRTVLCRFVLRNMNISGILKSEIFYFIVFIVIGEQRL